LQDDPFGEMGFLMQDYQGNLIKSGLDFKKYFTVIVTLQEMLENEPAMGEMTRLTCHLQSMGEFIKMHSVWPKR